LAIRHVFQESLGLFRRLGQGSGSADDHEGLTLLGVNGSHVGVIFENLPSFDHHFLPIDRHARLLIDGLTEGTGRLRRVKRDLMLQKEQDDASAS
jgi:hypothetical protein